LSDAGAEAEHGDRKVVFVDDFFEQQVLVERLREAPVRERHVRLVVGGMRDGLGRERKEVACGLLLLRQLAEDDRVRERSAPVLKHEQTPVFLLCEAEVDAEHVVVDTVHGVQGAVDVESVVVLDEGLRLRVVRGAWQQQTQQTLLAWIMAFSQHVCNIRSS